MTRDGNPQKNQRIHSISESNSGFEFEFYSQHKYLNIKIGKIILEWQIQQISTTDKH